MVGAHHMQLNGHLGAVMHSTHVLRTACVFAGGCGPVAGSGNRRHAAQPAGSHWGHITGKPTARLQRCQYVRCKHICFHSRQNPCKCLATQLDFRLLEVSCLHVFPRKWICHRAKCRHRCYFINPCMRQVHAFNVYANLLEHNHFHHYKLYLSYQFDQWR